MTNAETFDYSIFDKPPVIPFMEAGSKKDRKKNRKNKPTLPPGGTPENRTHKNPTPENPLKHGGEHRFNRGSISGIKRSQRRD